MEQPAEINVTVDNQNRYAINNVQVPFRDVAGLADDLKNAVNSKGDSKAEPIVKIGADGSASHQSVINIMEAARIAGLAKITFVAQTSGKK